MIARQLPAGILLMHMCSLLMAGAGELPDAEAGPPAERSAVAATTVAGDQQNGDKKRVWNHALPFMAQDVIDLGFDLPKPYGISIIPNRVRQELVLEDLSIRIDGGEWIVIDFVDFGSPTIDNKNVQLKFDAWVLPFLNVYVTYGKMEGEGEIPLNIEAGDFLGNIGVDCDGPLAPAICSQTINAVVEPEYEGENISLGLNLALGWRQFFLALPLTYTWSDVDIIDNTVESIFISPRVGVTQQFEAMGRLAYYIGANWLQADIDIVGSITLDEAGIPGIGGDTRIDYVISQSNKDRWNYLIGLNWDITDSWSLQGEFGSGGSRENIITSLTYRF
jgi:hypothetical protein